MNDIPTEKISALQNIIVARADGQRSVILDNARKEAQAWVEKETEKLNRETKLVEQDAKNRSEEIHRRQVLAAEREKSVEALRLQNRLLSELIGRFQDELVKLREKPNYSDILAGVTLKALKQLKVSKATFRLAALDAPLANNIIKIIKARNTNIEITFDPAPAPILGGCWVTTEDKKRQVNMDWQSQTQELSDLLADRLMAVL